MLKALSAGVALAIAIGTVQTGSAAQERALRAGDRVEVGGGQSVEIKQCRGAGWDEECFVQFYNDGEKSGPLMWFSARNIRAGEERVRAAAGLPPRATAGTVASSPPVQPGKPPTAPPVSRAAAAGQCPRTPYGGPVAGRTPASPALSKRKVADTYTMATRDPYWYGVTFESFTVGAPIRNKVSVVPGTGATRVTNGAPPNATLHPVKSRHVVCEQSPGQAKRRRVESSYFCFISKDDEWRCGGEGVPKITQLD